MQTSFIQSGKNIIIEIIISAHKKGNVEGVPVIARQIHTV